MGDRDRPKKTWKELDAMRGRGRASDRGERRHPKEDARASSQHRAALDALFARGELGKFSEKLAPAARQSPPRPAIVPPFGAGVPNGSSTSPNEAPPLANDPAGKHEEKLSASKEDARVVLRKKLMEAPSRESIGRAFDRYEKLYGMPRDFELIEQGLEHPKPDRVLEILIHLEELLLKEKPRRSRTLAGKLRLLEETSDEAEVRALAARIRPTLG
jgi:hypothetical protein